MKMVSKMRAGNLCATALLPATRLVASPFRAIPARRVTFAIAAAVGDRAQIVAWRACAGTVKLMQPNV